MISMITESADSSHSIAMRFYEASATKIDWALYAPKNNWQVNDYMK